MSNDTMAKITFGIGLSTEIERREKINACISDCQTSYYVYDVRTERCFCLDDLVSKEGC